MARLSDSAHARLEAISFFLAVLLASGLVVRWTWNSLARDFPRLPRIAFHRALMLVGIWGLVCLVALTMIATTRELMMPGSWPTKGLLYCMPPSHKPEHLHDPAITGDAAEDSPRSHGWIWQVAVPAACGWATFLARNLAHVRSSPEAILTGWVAPGLLAALVHACARRWYGRTSNGSAPPRTWKWKWTLSLLAGLAVMFAVAISSIGLARQIGWLVAAAAE